MVTAGTEYLFWSIFIAVGLLIWAVYETRELFRTMRKRNILQPPEPRCVAGGKKEFVGR